jgi:hypothetical protein
VVRAAGTCKKSGILWPITRERIGFPGRYFYPVFERTVGFYTRLRKLANLSEKIPGDLKINRPPSFSGGNERDGQMPRVRSVLRTAEADADKARFVVSHASLWSRGTGLLHCFACGQVVKWLISDGPSRSWSQSYGQRLPRLVSPHQILAPHERQRATSRAGQDESAAVTLTVPPHPRPAARSSGWSGRVP